jgi:hypothetical protein
MRARAPGRQAGWPPPDAGGQIQPPHQTSLLLSAQTRRQDPGERVAEHIGGSERAPVRTRQGSDKVHRRHVGEQSFPRGGDSSFLRRQGISSDHRSREIISGGGNNYQREARRPRRRRLYPGAKFQNFCLANFHVSVASPVASRSRLWNPSKVWEVATFPIPATSRGP